MTLKAFYTTNIADGETVYQRCLLVTGLCTPLDGNSTISIKTTGAAGIEAFPQQIWPSAGGNFKVLVMLSPGQNNLDLTYLHNDNVVDSLKIAVNYIPLLQAPPLHLAIMVAKDSPLLIDCPPAKSTGFSSAHADLEAAIAKFRMTAYMWQALTAEDLRKKGLMRRTFRLEEEWAADTVSQRFLNASYNETLAHEGAMRATAKVHIVRSSRTTKEIRDADVAQQNPSGRRKNELFDYFLEALKEAGGPFTSSAHPVVAGLILDSHYSMRENMILGHAALGCHNPKGISLGMFGSHLTYSWPRFLEEVTSCLTDTRAPGDTVGNDNNQCGSIWEACSIGQGAFLHEVGHAYGSPHGPGIMERGYAQDWPKNFLSKTAYCRCLAADGVVVDSSTPNDCRWNLRDALSFRMMPHFRIPSDGFVSPESRSSVPNVFVESDGGDEASASLQITSTIGIAQVAFNDKVEEYPAISDPATNLCFPEDQLEHLFDRAQPLSLKVLGVNGKEWSTKNVWRMFAVKTVIRIPGTDIRLYRKSVSHCDGESSSDSKYLVWAQLLKEKGPDGRIHRATSIDLRVGCIWDGGVVKYDDDHVSHWGLMRQHGRIHQFGGHASEEIDLPPNTHITKIEVNRGPNSEHYRGGWGSMYGIRMHLSNGTKAGELNADGRDGWSISTLEPTENEVIVGFYGKSEPYGCGVLEFGIITAPKSVGLDGLPDATFDMQELRNNDEIVNGDADDEDNHSEDDNGSQTE